MVVRFKAVWTLGIIAALGFANIAAAAGKEEKPTLTTAVAAAENVAVNWPMAASVYAPDVKRPGLLPALYVTLGAVQAWDVYSTSLALKAGAREANATAAPFTSSMGSMFGLKAATMAGTILCAEKMWKKNRVGAVVLMAAINGATAAVAMHNMQNARMLTAAR